MMNNAIANYIPFANTVNAKTAVTVEITEVGGKKMKREIMKNKVSQIAEAVEKSTTIGEVSEIMRRARFNKSITYIEYEELVSLAISRKNAINKAKKASKAKAEKKARKTSNCKAYTPKDVKVTTASEKKKNADTRNASAKKALNTSNRKASVAVEVTILEVFLNAIEKAETLEKCRALWILLKKKGDAINPSDRRILEELLTEKGNNLNTKETYIEKAINAQSIETLRNIYRQVRANAVMKNNEKLETLAFIEKQAKAF